MATPDSETTIGPPSNPKSVFVIELSDCASREFRVGNKAARLAELSRAGFPVPGGFVLTAAAFEFFTAAHGFSDDASQSSVSKAAVPPTIRDAIVAALGSWEGVPLAVRSSGLAEDMADASFAGQYVSVLNVEGADAVVDAVRRCWASAFSHEVAAYRRSVDGDCDRAMAVLVQRMVPADAAGVAFSADPLSGDRTVATVSAVRGLGDTLVSGDQGGEEWLVCKRDPRRRRGTDRVLTEQQVMAIIDLARDVDAHYDGQPQDIEWALVNGAVELLQARPMTALPEVVPWDSVSGCWVRDFRLGEWLGGPPTPSCASWLLSGIERRLHGNFSEWFRGLPMPDPGHVLINGWYFYGLEYMNMSPAIALRYVLPALLTNFRRSAALIPPLAHLGVDTWIREWRDELEPRYLETVARASGQVDTATPTELVEIIDELVAAAGDYFSSMTALAGYAAKAEYPLAVFWDERIAPKTGDNVLSVVRSTRGIGEPVDHAVQDLDWVHPTHGERDRGGSSGATASDAKARRVRLEQERDQAILRAKRALGNKKLEHRFDKLLAEAMRGHGLREEQSRNFTLPWPVLRRAVLRLGEYLVGCGVLAHVDEVFFIERDELVAAIGESPALAATAKQRRTLWNQRRALTPPLSIGELPKQLEAGLGECLRRVRTSGAENREGLHGLPASPGTASGPARVIRSLDELDRLQDGEILVATVTTPGWTPAFARAAAVVTDTGSLASHASVVAREYGIPAVVGTGDATSRICDGQRIVVDGSAGVIEGDGLA